MLVWEVKVRRKRRSRGQPQEEAAEEGVEAAQEESRSERRKAQLARWRDKFIQNLQSAGLLMEKVQLLGPFSQYSAIYATYCDVSNGFLFIIRRNHPV